MFSIWILTFTLFFNDGRPAERQTLASADPFYCSMQRDIVGEMASLDDMDHIDIVLNCVEERAS